MKPKPLDPLCRDYLDSLRQLAEESRRTFSLLDHPRKDTDFLRAVEQQQTREEEALQAFEQASRKLFPK